MAPTTLGMPSSPAPLQLPGENRGHRLGHAPRSPSPFTPVPARRDVEGQNRGRAGKRNDLFWGKKVCVSGLAPEGTTLHIPTGMGCWVPSGQAKLPAASLAIGQTPGAVPRKNPVKGRIGRQKLDGKGIGNNTK